MSSLAETVDALVEMGPQGIARFQESLPPEWISEALEATGAASLRLTVCRLGASASARRCCGFETSGSPPGSLGPVTSRGIWVSFVPRSTCSSFPNGAASGDIRGM